MGASVRPGRSLHHAHLGSFWIATNVDDDKRMFGDEILWPVQFVFLGILVFGIRLKQGRIIVTHTASKQMINCPDEIIIVPLVPQTKGTQKPNIFCCQRKKVLCSPLGP